MNKKVINLIIIFLIFILIILCFKKSDIIAISIIDSSLMFFKKVFPFLFMMMILNNFLIAIGMPYYINKLTKNPFIYILIVSALSGCPVNAIIIKEYLDKKYISLHSASLALTFTTLNNPLFLYNYFKLIFENNYIIIKLFLIIYLGNITLFLFFYKQLKSEHLNINYSKVNLKKAFIDSITRTIPSLLNIFAIIIFFKLICDMLIITNNAHSIFLRGLIEITQGLNGLNALNISIKIKELLTLVILSFAGFSIHIQIANILDDYPINYKYFYLSRIFLMLFSFVSLIGK